MPNPSTDTGNRARRASVRKSCLERRCTPDPSRQWRRDRSAIERDLRNSALPTMPRDVAFTVQLDAHLPASLPALHPIVQQIRDLGPKSSDRRACPLGSRLRFAQADLRSRPQSSRDAVTTARACRTHQRQTQHDGPGISGTQLGRTAAADWQGSRTHPCYRHEPFHPRRKDQGVGRTDQGRRDRSPRSARPSIAVPCGGS